MSADLESRVARFGQNEENVNAWAKGDASTSVDFGGGPVRSPEKLISDKNSEINQAANGILAQSSQQASVATAQAAASTASAVIAGDARDSAVGAKEAAGSFDTLADANAALGAIPENAGIYVTADTMARVGFWVKRAGVLVQKSSDTLMSVASRIRKTSHRNWVYVQRTESGKFGMGLNRAGRFILGVGGDIVARISASETNVASNAASFASQRAAFNPSARGGSIFRVVNKARSKVAFEVTRTGRILGWGRDLLAELDTSKLLGVRFKVSANTRGPLVLIRDSLYKVVFQVTKTGRVKIWGRDVLQEIDAIKAAVSPTAPRPNTQFLVETFLDGTGKYQLRTTRRSDSKVTVLTTAGNNADPHLTDDNNVIFISDLSGTWQPAYLPALGGVPYPLAPDATVVVFWGDSLTAGAGSSGSGAGQGPVSRQFASRTGKTVYNFGIGGQSSNAIAARQGGAPSKLTVAGNLIPAAGVVAVTDRTVQLLTNQGTQSLVGVLAGIVGTLARDADGSYSFTRSAAGAATTCPAATEFYPQFGIEHRADVAVLTYGRNDGGADATGTLNYIAASVAYLTPLYKRYVIGLILTSAAETIGTAQYTTITAKNDAIKAAYPNNWYDTTSPPTTAEMTAIGYAPTADDLADIIGGVIPRGMRSNPPVVDVLHGNNFLYALQALRLQAFFASKGW